MDKLLTQITATQLHMHVGMYISNCQFNVTIIINVAVYSS